MTSSMTTDAFVEPDPRRDLLVDVSGIDRSRITLLTLEAVHVLVLAGDAVALGDDFGCPAH